MGREALSRGRRPLTRSRQARPRPRVLRWTGTVRLPPSAHEDALDRLAARLEEDPRATVTRPEPGVIAFEGSRYTGTVSLHHDAGGPYATYALDGRKAFGRYHRAAVVFAVMVAVMFGFPMLVDNRMGWDGVPSWLMVTGIAYILGVVWFAGGNTLMGLWILRSSVRRELAVS